MKIVYAFTLPLLVCVALAACAHDETRGGQTTTTGGRANPPISERVIDSIATARCDREAKCNNVGTDKTYANTQACLSDLRGKGMNELTESSCPKGIDQSQLDKCLADVRGERCGNPLDTLSRVNSCRTGALCPN